ncbi:GFA family protein [Variovorax sp. dw_954]|uniref:GFA family protein n=1 Tax=Variovorax sp. dw_954 TaxID=2720078 RepID=UPI001BD4D8E3|nr:GFA family protein [Variovorax sp. dw_954]
MTHQGSCHCGRNKFEVEGDIASVTECNCSICQRKGALLWFVSRSALHLLSPESDGSVYQFHTHAIKHHFCPHCGIHTYGEAKTPDGNTMAAINARCIEGIDLQAIPVQHFDGRSMK